MQKDKKLWNRAQRVITIHQLNFWQESNWRRESTINPNFLMIVMIAFFLIVAAWLFTDAFHARATVETELEEVQEQYDSFKDLAAEVKERQNTAGF